MSEDYIWVLLGAALMGAMKPLLELLSRIFRLLFRGRDWILEQDKGAQELEKFRQETEQRFLQVEETHRKAVREIKEEQSLIIYGNLACLKGLQEQGCNGPVSDAVVRLEKYLNEKAHE